MMKKLKMAASAVLLIQAVAINAQNVPLLPQFAMLKSVEAQTGVPARPWSAPADDVSLPEAVDNSILEAFPPIFNQIGGSCAQAATIGYMFTYEVNSLLGRKADVPENRFSYLYSWNFINGGKDEGSLSWDGIASSGARNSSKALPV